MGQMTGASEDPSIKNMDIASARAREALPSSFFRSPSALRADTAAEVTQPLGEGPTFSLFSMQQGQGRAREVAMA